MDLVWPRRLTAGLTAAYLVLVPVSWSSLPWNIQWADVAFIGLCVSLLLTRPWARTKLHPVDLLVGLYLVGSLGSFAGTSDVSRSLLELAKHGYLAVVYAVFSLLARREEQAVRIAWWCSVASGVLAVIGVLAILAYQLLGVPVPWIGSQATIPIFGDVYRIKGTLHSEEFLGDYFTFTVGLLLGFALTSGRGGRTPWRWLLAAMAITSVATFSRSVAGLLAGGLACSRLGMPGSMRPMKTIVGSSCRTLPVFQGRSGQRNF
jgi:hypothetical protein